jgi:hypothetical protein
MPIATKPNIHPSSIRDLLISLSLPDLLGPMIETRRSSKDPVSIINKCPPLEIQSVARPTEQTVEIDRWSTLDVRARHLKRRAHVSAEVFSQVECISITMPGFRGTEHQTFKVLVPASSAMSRGCIQLPTRWGRQSKSQTPSHRKNITTRPGKT